MELTMVNNLVTSTLIIANMDDFYADNYQCGYISTLDNQEKKSKNIELHIYGKKITAN